MHHRSASASPVGLLLYTALTVAMSSACGVDEPIGEARGPSVTRGPLTLAPIVFVETDYYLIPTRRRLIPGPRKVDADEGWLRVPARHGSLGRDSITIHFVRFASTSDAPGPPIVYLAGGPGGSGTWSASGDRFDLFQRLRALGDVIALDQRGTYYADPYLLCPGSWEYPLDQPTDSVVYVQAVTPFLERCHAHWADSVDVDAFNTRESAEDLDDLREALGADQLVLWGISYGTHLGLAYIRQHPDRVAGAILAGVEGPDHTYKLPGNLDRVLLRVDSAMKADSELRAVLPDFLGAFETRLSELEREPARITISHPETGEERTVVLGADDLRRGVFGELGEREDIVQFPARAIPVMQGDYSEIAQLVARARLGTRELAMSLAMDCASGRSAERFGLIQQQAQTAILGDAGNFGINAHCAVWPHVDLGDEYRSPVQSDAPVLFISGTLDIRTPPSNAEEVRQGFPNSHHLIIEGGSHDDDLFLSSPTILETMVAFLRGETDLPERVVLPPIRFERP